MLLKIQNCGHQCLFEKSYDGKITNCAICRKWMQWYEIEDNDPKTSTITYRMFCSEVKVDKKIFCVMVTVGSPTVQSQKQILMHITKNSI